MYGIVTARDMRELRLKELKDFLKNYYPLAIITSGIEKAKKLDKKELGIQKKRKKTKPGIQKYCLLNPNSHSLLQKSEMHHPH